MLRGIQKKKSRSRIAWFIVEYIAQIGCLPQAWTFRNMPIPSFSLVSVSSWMSLTLWDAGYCECSPVWLQHMQVCDELNTKGAWESSRRHVLSWERTWNPEEEGRKGIKFPARGSLVGWQKWQRGVAPLFSCRKNMSEYHGDRKYVWWYISNFE